MRPVFISHAGLWCAAGHHPAEIRRALAERRIPQGRLSIFKESFPYAFATGAEVPCRARLEEGLRVAGESLDLRNLPADAPILIGSSSSMIGAADEAGWPLPADFTFDMNALMKGIQAFWQVPNSGWTFSCGCTSGLHGLEAAVGLVESGAKDEAIVVGIEIRNRTTPAGFASLQLLSPSGSCPLDRARNGLVLGEAVAAIRVSATPSPWRIHAPTLLLDATNVTGHAEDGSTIAQGMGKALERAGVAPEAIRAVKVQAAGSPGSDAVEVRALMRAFPDGIPPLLSIKASLGHTLGACGLAEMAALLFCGEEGWLPGTAGFSGADPELGVKPVLEPFAWSQGPILLNIQGFGGGIASWVVERV